jgi:AcrR family transcriptional regulator
MAVDANTVNIKTRGYHHGDLREALVDAGMALLEQRQAEPPGLREVARSVGVSATAVYRHFPDKDALLRAIAARGFARMGEMQLAAGQGLSGEVAFSAIGVAYVRFALDNPAVFRLMFSRPKPRDLFGLPQDEASTPLRLLREHAAAMTPTGLPDEARRVMALQAWALVHGLAVLMLDHMVDVDDAMIARVISEW